MNRRIPISQGLKNDLYKKYFNNSEGFCVCCKREKITYQNFECGHVKSVIEGGTNEIQNLRPIWSYYSP